MPNYLHGVGRKVRATPLPRALIASAAGVRPAGLVLNRLPRRRGAGYYYYYTSDGYGTAGGAYAGQYGRRHSATSNVASNGAGGGS